MPRNLTISTEQLNWRERQRAARMEQQAATTSWEADLGTWERGRVFRFNAPDRTQATYIAAHECKPGEDVIDLRGPFRSGARR